MTEQGYTTTNQLAIVIDAIQLGRKTGTLTVLRREEAGRNEGRIIFISGQITKATLGYLRGPAALKVLTNWQQCQFIFQPSIASIPLSTDTPARLPTPLNSTNKRAEPIDTERIDRSSPLFIVPYRTRTAKEALHEIEKRGLTRTHRHLFLLIDGQRAIKDLVVLTGRSPYDLFLLLGQLEEAGLVRK